MVELKLPYLMELPVVKDIRGCLSFIEHPSIMPFPIQTVSWLYDLHAGAEILPMAHKKNELILIPLTGSFSVKYRDSEQDCFLRLNRSYNCVVIPNLTWYSLVEISANCVVLKLSSEELEPSDMITDFLEYEQICSRV
jgi:hypothetical protein